MTLEERCRLSCYKEIAEISSHKNVKLVQHVESKHIYVKKEQAIYNKEIYDFLMQCNNPHIPRIYECIENDGRLIVIEEYVQGESLEEYLARKGTLDKEEVCHIMITICDVLEQLHQLPQPVIHRDLKPDNIIIQESGYLKIIDFNTAKQFEAGKDSDTVIIGTREFAAPEQYGFQQSDARTDIYAMGVMMNYLLTQEYPKNLLYLSESRHSDPMTKIIQKCVEFAPDRRYQTVMELRRDLQKCIKKSPITQEQNSNRTNVYKEEKKKSTGFWNNPYLPPGFRTGKIWKMLVAIYGYFYIFWISAELEVSTSDGSAAVGIELWANRIAVLLWLLFTVVFWLNYLGIQQKFPMMQRKESRWIGYLLYPFLFVFAEIMVLTIFTN